MEELRILVADDHDKLRASVVRLLSSDFHVVGAVANGEELVQAAILLYPDVIVSDIDMPLLDGVSARKELLARGIDRPFVFMSLTSEMAATRLQGGFLSYVHKNDLWEELKLAIQATAAGRSYRSKSVNY